VNHVMTSDPTTKMRKKFSIEVAKKLDRNPAAQRIDSDLFDMFIVNDFMSEKECLHTMRMIDRTAEPSLLYKADPDAEFRTSYSGNFEPKDPFVKDIDKRISKLLGLNPKRGETIQGQRYDVGQQFKPHHDYFHVTESYWQKEKNHGGQRIWTAMVYLNEPEAGGATGFPKAEFVIEPRPGMILVWNNLNKEGDVNPATLHSGNPVEAGSKYVITKWFREGFWG